MAKFTIHFQGYNNGEFSYDVNAEFDTEKDNAEQCKLACNSAISCTRMLVDQLRLYPVSTSKVDNSKHVREALISAQHELTTLHGLRVTDIPDADCSWVIDTSNANKLIHDALESLQK